MRRIPRCLVPLFLLVLHGCTRFSTPHPSQPALTDRTGHSPAIVLAAEGTATPATTSTPLTHAVTLAPGQAAVAGNLNAFSQSLYADVARTQKGNLAVSPLGSFILLEMLYEGASGPAQQEIVRACGFTPTTLTDLGALLEELEALPSLSLAQKIYLDNRAKLVEAYLHKVGPLLAEPVQVVPFSSDPPGATKIINDWVELKTKGLIKNFLPELPPLTVAVLVSVLHFKGEWAYQFPKQATVPADFTLSDGSTMKVPMMRLQTRGLDLIALSKGSGVVLPYTDGTEMVLLLPDAGVSSDSLWKELLSAEYPSARPAGTQVIVELPRFEFSVPTFPLTDNWKALGLEQTVNGPDLSKMLTLDPPDPVELKVFHKTYIKVNEEGTEAAAATAVVVGRKGMSAEAEPTRIRFDRPFGFLLRNSKYKTILMMGRVERPEQAG